MTKTAAIADEEEDFVISSLSPTLAQKRLAVGVVLVLFSVLLAIASPVSAGVHLPRVSAFVPIYATAMFVTDSITAVLLFAQFSVLRLRALLAIASGYLFTGLISVPWLLTFPTIFSPLGLLGAGLSSTTWLYTLWHSGFPTFVIAYVLLKEGDPRRRFWRGSPRVAILSSVGITAALVCTGTVVATAGHDRLPALMLDTVNLSKLWFYVGAFAALLNVLALGLVWARRRSVLDLWLIVVMCACVIELCLSFPVPARYSVGWYSGRLFGFLSGSLVLFVLLYETTTLYGALLRALLAQRRERLARLLTGEAVSASIAHELRQPLAAMTTDASAGLRWLDRARPDVEEAKAALKNIVAAGHRAGGIIDSIRALFRKDGPMRASLDLNELIRESLSLMRGELQAHRISVQVEPGERLPRVKGDRIQLQQVLLNLITNAIEAMVIAKEPRILSVTSTSQDSDSVLISVEDTGEGVEPNHLERIFSPRFTTKARGTGMGLAICRSIIEAHEGHLWAASNRPLGAAFRFTLPADNGLSADFPDSRGR